MRGIRLATAAVAVLFVTTAMPGIATGATSAPGGTRAAVRASLQSDINDYLTAYGAAEHISAVSLTVTFPGSKPGFDLAAGTARYGGRRAISTDALWQIGSNTKAFTSVLILQLEAEHKLSINDTLGTWLPQYAAWSGVTIKQLLNMTSGIANYTNSSSYWRDIAAAPNGTYSASRLVSYAVGLPPTHGYSYSNTNYILAQMVVEQAAHASYGSQLRKRIFVPLDLHDTFFSATRYPGAITDRLPSGYWFAAPLPGMPLGQDESRLTLSWAQGAGGIIGSLQDLATWDRALYGGRVLPAQQQRELTSLVSAATGQPIKKTTLTDNAGYGLGVNQVTTTGLGTLWYYEGETNGFRVLNIYVPRSNTAITIGVNSTTLNDHTGELGTSIYQTLHDAGLG